MTTIAFPLSPADRFTALIEAFSQPGSFTPSLPVPFKAAPGKYSFTLSASATETCASDPAKTLSATASKQVTVAVGKTNRPP